VTGRMTSSTEWEKKSGSMAPHSMVLMRMEESTDLDNSSGLMVPRMLETLSMVPSVVKEFIPGPMAENMTVSGSKERCTELV